MTFAHVCTYAAEHNILFSVRPAERNCSFTYKKAGLGGQHLHKAEKRPPGAPQQQPLCALAQCTVISTAWAPGTENPSCNFILCEVPSSFICAME